MRTRIPILLCALFFTTNIAAANESNATEEQLQFAKKIREARYKLVPPPKNLRGWEHLFSRLVESGMDPEYLVKTFRDKRMPRFNSLYFSLEPRESAYPYSKLNSRARRKTAIRFYKKHKEHFAHASLLFHVPESVILAILQVETNCGSYTGNARVFHRLARLAAASDPSNIQRNFVRTKKKDKTTTFTEVEDRAQWLEQTFLPHVAATFIIAEQVGVHPLELRGSSAGAMGLAQFLPGNILAYGVDGNQDGQIDLFEPADAIFSIASFLAGHGWKATDMSEEEREQVIRHYNRSEPYVRTVFQIAKALSPELEKVKKS